jgi:hypothetical protein
MLAIDCMLLHWLGGPYWSILPGSFPARKGPFLSRILLTLIGVGINQFLDIFPRVIY